MAKMSAKKFGNQDENITIIRSKRKTIAIEIRPSGIILRAPWRMKNADISAFLKSKEDWIKKHQKKMEERRAVLNEQTPFTAEQMQEFAEKALKIIPERVRYYAPLIGVDYGRITIRNQRTRWGSCSSKGNLNFNCLLVLFPDGVLDSVVVHELCHRKHMNHSAEFYNEILKVFPEYQRCNEWLKENGGLFLGRIPR